MNDEDKKLFEQMCRENYDLLHRAASRFGSWQAVGIAVYDFLNIIKENEFFTVSEVAGFLETSERRVRTLLAEGRIDGFKDERDIWRVKSPLNIKPGTRGPDLQGYPARKLQPRKLKIVKREGS